MNPWHDFPVGSHPPEVVTAVIEIPRGSRNKYELDKGRKPVSLRSGLRAALAREIGVHRPGQDAHRLQTGAAKLLGERLGEADDAPLRVVGEDDEAPPATLPAVERPSEPEPPTPQEIETAFDTAREMLSTDFYLRRWAGMVSRILLKAIMLAVGINHGLSRMSSMETISFRFLGL